MHWVVVPCTVSFGSVTKADGRLTVCVNSPHTSRVFHCNAVECGENLKCEGTEFGREEKAR